MAKATTAEDDAPQARPFADFLRDLSRGRTHDDLSEALRDLAQSVSDTGKAGAIQLTIAIKPMKGADTGALMVTPAIKVKRPEHDPKASVFFSNDGYLQRNDPHQLAFDGLREVGGKDETDDSSTKARGAQA